MIDALRKLGRVLRPPRFDPDTDPHIVALRESRAFAERVRLESEQALAEARQVRAAREAQEQDTTRPPDWG
jgi:hypothetical protein